MKIEELKSIPGDIVFVLRRCIDDVFPATKWVAFGILWEWAIEQEWWGDFLYNKCQGTIYAANIRDNYEFEIPNKYINPERFAKAIYEFLKARENV